MNIAIIGTGGIGGYYGARLAHGGHDVHFLLNTEYEYVRDNGLIVDSYLGNFSLENPLVYNDINDMPKCDMICICVKATKNAEIFPMIAPIIKADSNIILLQNGIGYEEELLRLYPDTHIFGGMCFISSFREGQGYIKHTAYGKITIASLNEEDTERLEEVKNLFEIVGIEVETTTDLALGRWKKLVWNMPYNGLTVIADCSTDKLAASKPMRKLAKAIMEEVMGAAEACGVEITPSFIEAMIESTDNIGAYNPSMRLDFLAKRPMEIDTIYGNPIKLAESSGYDMKYCKMIKWQLENIQAEY